MKSSNGAGSVSSDVAAKHRRLVGNALTSDNAAMMLRAYHAKGIDIGACALEGSPTDRSILEATYLGRVDVIMLLHELVGAEVVNDTDKEEGWTPCMLQLRSIASTPF